MRTHTYYYAVDPVYVRPSSKLQVGSPEQPKYKKIWKLVEHKGERGPTYDMVEVLNEQDKIPMHPMTVKNVHRQFLRTKDTDPKTTFDSSGFTKGEHQVFDVYFGQPRKDNSIKLTAKNMDKYKPAYDKFLEAIADDSNKQTKEDLKQEVQSKIDILKKKMPKPVLRDGEETFDSRYNRAEFQKEIDALEKKMKAVK